MIKDLPATLSIGLTESDFFLYHPERNERKTRRVNNTQTAQTHILSGDRDKQPWPSSQLILM